MRRVGVIIAVSAVVLVARAAELNVGVGGRVDMPSARCSFVPRAHMPGWKDSHSGVGGYEVGKDGLRRFRIFLDSERKARIDGTIAAKARDDGAAEIECAFTPAQDTPLEQLCMSGTIKPADYGGGKIVADGEELPLPAGFSKTHIYSKSTRRISFHGPSGDERFALSFVKPTYVLVQDDRKWNAQSFTIRVFPEGKVGGVYKGGETRRLSFVVSVPGGLSVENRGPVKIVAGADWVPLVPEPDIVPGSALDFSSLCGRDAPAGKHGRVVARGPHFEFEGMPGVPQRFYGVNLCFTAN